MVYAETEHLGRPRKRESGGLLSHPCFLWLQRSAQLASWPLAQTASLCENQWNHICAAPRCGPGTSAFQVGGSVMVSPAKSCPENWGHLASWSGLCACEQNCLTLCRDDQAGGSPEEPELGVCVCVCVCLSCIEALSPCSLYLWCFTRWETKGLCVFFKVLCADCGTHPGKTQPKAMTLPLVQTPNATYTG